MGELRVSLHFAPETITQAKVKVKVFDPAILVALPDIRNMDTYQVETFPHSNGATVPQAPVVTPAAAVAQVMVEHLQVEHPDMDK